MEINRTCAILTTMPCVQRSLYLNEMTDDFGHIQVEVSKGVDGRTGDVLDNVGRPVEKQRESRQKRDLVQERKPQLKK